VAAKDVHFYSEGIQCYGRLFSPKGLSAESKAPAVVLAPGWGETAQSTEQYAARFASRGLLAMAIDYRGGARRRFPPNRRFGED
jgi:dienelactone hydrolase